MLETLNDTTTTAARIAALVARREALTARSRAFSVSSRATLNEAEKPVKVSAPTGSAGAVAGPHDDVASASRRSPHDGTRAADAELSARTIWADAADLGIAPSPAMVAGAPSATTDESSVEGANHSAGMVLATGAATTTQARDAVVAPDCSAGMVPAPEPHQVAAESAPVVSGRGGAVLPSASSRPNPRAVRRQPMVGAVGPGTGGIPAWLVDHLRACGVRAGP